MPLTKRPEETPMSQASSVMSASAAATVLELTPDALKARLIYQSVDVDECTQHVRSYQKMACTLGAERDWSGLGRLINNANRNARTAGDGTRIAAAVVQAVWDAVLEVTGPDDLIGLDREGQVFIDAAIEHPTNDGIRSLAGYVATWLGTRHRECGNQSTAKRWFDLATDLVIDPGPMPSPLNGRLSYELVTGAGTDIHDLTTAFHYWRSQDAEDPEAYALFGWHLLPQNYGSYNLLHETARQLHDDAGPTGSKVAAFYWEAISADSEALASMDFDIFSDSLKSTLASAEDHDVAVNGICSYLYGLGNRATDRKGEAPKLRARRDEIDALFDEIVRSELSTVLTHLWDSGDTALYGVASAFADDINAGKSVSLGQAA